LREGGPISYEATPSAFFSPTLLLHHHHRLARWRELFDFDAGVYFFCADTFTIPAAVGIGGRAASAKLSA